MSPDAVSYRVTATPAVRQTIEYRTIPCVCDADFVCMYPDAARMEGIRELNLTKEFHMAIELHG